MIDDPRVAAMEIAAIEISDEYGEKCLQMPPAEYFGRLLAAADRAAWRTMESAPRDGTHILLHDPEFPAVVECIQYRAAEWTDRRLVYWQPLPAPPPETER